MRRASSADQRKRPVSTDATRVRIEVLRASADVALPTSRCTPYRKSRTNAARSQRAHPELRPQVSDGIRQPGPMCKHGVTLLPPLSMLKPGAGQESGTCQQEDGSGRTGACARQLVLSGIRSRPVIARKNGLPAGQSLPCPWRPCYRWITWRHMSHRAVSGLAATKGYTGGVSELWGNAV